MASKKPKYGMSLYEWCQGVIGGKHDVPDYVKERMGPGKEYKDAEDFAKKLLQSYNAGGNIKDAKEISRGSDAKVWWEQKCREDQKPHRWEATVNNRSAGSGCSVCDGKTVQVGDNDLASKRPDLAAEWDWEANAEAHDKDTKHPRTPEEVTVSSTKKVWWKRKCRDDREPHRWEATVANRSKGIGCSVCDGRTIQVGDNDLASKRPDLAAEWDYKANEAAHGKNSKHPRTPEEVTVSSTKKVWWKWKCREDQEDHRWEATVYDRSKGRGCSVCNGKTVQAGVNDLASKRPELVDEWDYKANAKANDVNPKHPRTPQEVTYSSHKKVHWQCSNDSCGNKWKAKVGSRYKGRGCSSCAKSGFKDNKPAWIYAIESDPGGQLPEPCIKLGISNVGSVAGRLGKHSARFKSLEGVGIFGPGKAIREIESLLKKDKGKLAKKLGYRLWKENYDKTFDGSSETLIDKRVAENSTASLKDLLEEILEQEEVEKILAQPEVQAFMEDYGLEKEDLEVVDLTPETIKEYRNKCQAAKAEKDSDPGLAEAA